ncbi:RHS repeat protein [Vibrio sp.]|uniref:RHS repeat domain-containing protein n=1 Tax=Vibrio sp. TaxID=678 RepID=UPI00311F675F
MSMIKSNAYNFPEFISTGVDPRTGSYSFSINIGEFLSHKSSGIALRIILNYNPARIFDMGFGRGWDLVLSRFNSTSNELSLSSGQTFTIEWNSENSEYDIPYRKLKDIRVFFLNAGEEIKVVYKDGRQEFIDYHEGTLTRIVSPQGLVTYFDYSRPNNRNYPVLWRIYDDAGRELTINWWENTWQTVVRHSFGGTSYQELLFNKTGSGNQVRLSTIQLPALESLISLQYRYLASSQFDVIEEVRHPTGLIERMTYLDLGHSLPNEAPFSKVPYITEHRIISGQNQPDQVVTYTYSATNYLGFASDRAWVAGEDTLFKSRSNYEYWSEETINGTRSVIRTYNKYHLLKCAEYLHNGSLYRLEENDYFAHLDRGIEYQPATYSFIKKQRTTHYQESSIKTITTRYQYDDFGNQTYVQQADGSEITRTFYPVGGEGDRCPPEPNNMVSLLKRESFIPVNTANGEVARVVDMTYLSLPKLNSSDEAFILVNEMAFHDHRVCMTYHDNSSCGHEYGLLATQSVIVNDMATTTSFQYDFSAHTLNTTKRLTTYDGLFAITSESIRYLDSQICNNTDSEGIEVITTYDVLGRKITHTEAPNTAYEVVERFEYFVGAGINKTITTRVNGSRLIQFFNNAGNEIEVQQSDANGVLRTIRELHYDSFGLLVRQIDSDWFDGTPLHLTTWYEYDVNGEVSKVTYPDGREEVISQNIASLTTTHEKLGLSKQITSFNESGLEESKETQDSNSQRFAFTQHVYDGYSNLIQTIDNNQSITSYSYDNSDRLISTNRVVNGQSVTQSIEYASFSTDELVTRIAVNGTYLGHQEYDGLSRLTRSEVSGMVQNIGYSGSSMMPSTRSTPRGARLDFSNNKYLQAPMAISIANKPELGKVFTYDVVTGGVTQAINQSSQQRLGYNSLGQLTSESVELNDLNQREARYRYSLLGKLLSKTDFFGHNSTYTYDDYGRLHTVTTTNGSQVTTTTLSYDTYSRPVRYDTNHGDDFVSILLTLNDFGLETQRVVKVNGVEKFTLSQRFNHDLQISEKVYRESGQVTIETMTYDQLQRLATYLCIGPNAPKDEHDNIIRSQSFNYDVYGNIVKVDSEFSDGSSNTANFTYSPDNPTQLRSHTNTHPTYPSSLAFSYDAAGNLLCDDQGKAYQYNALDQIESVSKQGSELSRYQYDVQGRVVSQTHENKLIYLYYQGDKLANEFSEGVHSSYQNILGATSSRVVQSGSVNQHQFLVPNGQGSIVSTLSSSDRSAELVAEKRSYTPYGEE